MRAGAFEWVLVLHLLVAPVLWLAAPVGLGYLLAAIDPAIVGAIMTSAGFNHGQLIAVVAVALSGLLSSSTHLSMRLDFVSVASRYIKEGEALDQFAQAHADVLKSLEQAAR